ncbi:MULTISPECIES: hypothetical protein [unclassified Okeania]|nr:MULTISPECIES: hypothetical protein [unclassified Okeania]
MVNISSSKINVIVRWVMVLTKQQNWLLIIVLKHEIGTVVFGWNKEQK